MVNVFTSFIKSTPIFLPWQRWIKEEVKSTLEQAAKTQRGSRGIALLIISPRH
jgi:hypothetical protein